MTEHGDTSMAAQHDGTPMTAQQDSTPTTADSVRLLLLPSHELDLIGRELPHIRGTN